MAASIGRGSMFRGEPKGQEVLGMGRRQIDAQQAVRDIVSGMDDTALMEKYRLSARGLQSLLGKLVAAGVIQQSDIDRRAGGESSAEAIGDEGGRAKPPGGVGKPGTPAPDAAKAVIKAQKVVNEIRAGRTDAEFMKKYHLSAKGLQTLFDKLVAKGLIDRKEIEKRVSALYATVDIRGLREEFKRDPASAGPQVRPEEAQRCPNCGKINTMVGGECLSCGFTAEKLAKRMARQAMEERAAGAVWICPACETPQDEEHEVCPRCGVRVSQFMERQSRDRQAPRRDQRQTREEQIPKGMEKTGGYQISSMTKLYVVLAFVILLLVLVAVYFLLGLSKKRGNAINPQSSIAAIFQRTPVSSGSGILPCRGEADVLHLPLTRYAATDLFRAVSYEIRPTDQAGETSGNG